jgi:hypothetical protein
MGAFLLRLGGLVLVADIVYLVVWETSRGGADAGLFRSGLLAAAACVAGGLVVGIAARARSGITARSCPTCGRRVARGRMYCDDHLAETINRYRDEQRHKGE